MARPPQKKDIKTTRTEILKKRRFILQRGTLAARRGTAQA
jgi:hypothetical protein